MFYFNNVRLAFNICYNFSSFFRIINNLELPIYGDGNYYRDWLYVQDHVDAIDVVFHKGKKYDTYNIGGFGELNNIELVKLLSSIMDNKLKRKQGSSEKLITFVADRLGHDFRYSLDNEKIKNLGWKPEIDWNSGIENTIDWYINNNEWIKKILENNYKGERLGLDK